MERLKGLGPSRMDVKRQYGAALVVSMLMFNYGLAAGWPATVLPHLMSPEESPLASGPVSLEDSTWLATLLTITGIPVAPLVAVACERWGRKSVGYLTGALHVFSNLLPAFSLTIEALYVSRSLLGWACAFGFIFTPLYIREISDDETRGPLGVLMTIVINVGVLAVYVIGTYCSVVTTSWLCALPAVLFLVLLFWLPETPVYLLMKGREDEARSALVFLRGPRYDVQAEVDCVNESLRSMKANVPGGPSILKELFTSKASRRAGIIMIGIMINQQFSGLFCIVSYTVQIFQEAGSNMSPYLSSIVVGFMMLVGTIVSVFLCKRMGRKILLIISDVFMAVSLFGMGLYFYLKHIGEDTSKFGWVTLVCLSVYIIGFNIGLGPISMLVYTEIFSPKLVSTALAVSGPIPGILSFIIGKFFYTVADIVGVYTCYWGFATTCALGVAFIIAAVPETKNRPIDSILKELEGISPEIESRPKKGYDPVDTNAI
ncbi:hypothetical protein R5R35_008058 [Gryllus longicercus]|uniref:Major facilitator superfamily (MFS) profile domain-containing protein n=1 Tax=Gryllus longicercus TaxID=2509291 RepID=A0AAN9VU47_9ORTH